MSQQTRPPIALLLTAALLAGRAGEAQRSEPASAPFSGITQVVSVEVPVNVVDRDGTPVRGLTADQFEVLDDGERQRLTGFEVVDYGDPAGVTASPNEPLPSAARRHFLLLFDLSFATPTAILRARHAARDFMLTALHPNDLAAVAVYTLEHGPKLVVTFTPDRAQLARGIDTLGASTPDELLVDRDPLRFVIAPPASEASLTSGMSLGGNDSFRAQRDQLVLEHMRVLASVADRTERMAAEARIAGYTSGLADLARALHTVPGRKQVIYFSEGFDSRLMLGRAPGSIEFEEDTRDLLAGRIWMTDSESRFGNTQLQNDVRRMLEEFRRADCVVQAIDVGGLRAPSGGGTAERGSSSGQEVLFYIANETGGELYRNANDFRTQLTEVLARSDVTYVLTFERSDLPADGSYRRLRVRIKDLPSGARISHRPGYYAPRPFQDLHPLEKSLLASDAIASAVPQRGVELAVLAAPFRATPQLAYVPVILEVDGSSLLAGQQGDELTVEIYAYVSDGKGEMRDFFTQVVRVDLTRARRILDHAGLKYYGHLDLPPGQYRVRVLVRNAETGRTGVESLPLSVPAFATAEPYLLPPLFLAGQDGWLMVRERDAEEAESMVYPFTLKGEPYVPAARPVLAHGSPADFCLVGYNLGPELQLEGRVVASDGQSVALGELALVERTATGIAGLDKLIATFEPARLAAGDYVLQVAIADTASGRREGSSLPFTVR